MVLSLTKSRKLRVLLLMLGCLAANALAGYPVSSDELTKAVQLAIAWMMGQGIADHGAGGTTRKEPVDG